MITLVVYGLFVNLAWERRVKWKISNLTQTIIELANQVRVLPMNFLIFIDLTVL